MYQLFCRCQHRHLSKPQPLNNEHKQLPLNPLQNKTETLYSINTEHKIESLPSKHGVFPVEVGARPEGDEAEEQVQIKNTTLVQELTVKQTSTLSDVSDSLRDVWETFHRPARGLLQTVCPSPVLLSLLQYWRFSSKLLSDLI